MRFMMIVKATPNCEAGIVPDKQAMSELSKYNEELTKAGALIALDGSQPLSKGARISFSGGTPTVTDGPYAEAKEVVGGYWMLQFKSKQEAIDWVKKCPAQDGDVIEIRPVFEMSDFPEDVQKAADSATVKAQLEKNVR